MKITVFLIRCMLPVLLFLCLIDFPYGFYMLVRSLAMLGFAIIALYEFQRDRTAWGIFYLVLLIMFQPIFKIPFGRTLWNVLDVVVGVWLIVSIFIDNVQNPSSKVD